MSQELACLRPCPPKVSRETTVSHMWYRVGQVVGQLVRPWPMRGPCALVRLVHLAKRPIVWVIGRSRSADGLRQGGGAHRDALRTARRTSRRRDGASKKRSAYTNARTSNYQALDVPSIDVRWLNASVAAALVLMNERTQGT